MQFAFNFVGKLTLGRVEEKTFVLQYLARDVKALVVEFQHGTVEGIEDDTAVGFAAHNQG